MIYIISKSAYSFIQEAGKRLNKSEKISTIFTVMLAAFTGFYSIYAGSKAPMKDFTCAAAKEFGSRRFSVTNMAPRPMDTPLSF
ncbi:hypothetical protein K7432_012887, partial [Basidiobolus ranarum]